MAPESSRSPTSIATTWVGKCIYADNSAIEMGRPARDRTVRCSVVLASRDLSPRTSMRVSQRRPGRVLAVRHPVIMNGRMRPNCLGESCPLTAALSCRSVDKNLRAQLSDERGGQQCTDLFQEQVGLVADEADVATRVCDHTEVAPVGDRRHEQVPAVHCDDDLLDRL